MSCVPPRWRVSQYLPLMTPPHQLPLWTPINTAPSLPLAKHRNIALRADGWTHRFWGFYFVCIFMFYSKLSRFRHASRKIEVPGWSEASFWRYDPQKFWPQMAPVWILVPLDIFPLPSISVNYKNIWNKSKQIDKERTFRLFEIESNEETKSNLLSTYWKQNPIVIQLIISRITYEGETSEY